MKVRQILLCAWRTYTAHFGALLQGFLLQAVVCLIALAPLLFLSVPQAAPLAWLCPVLFVLLVLPMRQNAAQALALPAGWGRVSAGAGGSLPGLWSQAAVQPAAGAVAGGMGPALPGGDGGHVHGL